MICLMIKYLFWYLVSHYHASMADVLIDRMSKYISNDKKFKRLGLRCIYHQKRFWEIQTILDDIKEKVYDKHPEYREEV